MTSFTVHENFESLIQVASKNEVYVKAIAAASEIYNFRHANIENLNPESVRQIYLFLMQRVYPKKIVNLMTPWFENQRRIFIWCLFNYINYKKVKLEQMQMDDWEYFQQIFPYRDSVLFRYQAKLILSQSSVSGRHDRWSEKQESALKRVVQLFQGKFRWNDVAKQFFKESKEIYFRTPKQCRERWINHLDPSRCRQQWSSDEDSVLFQQVFEIGKKWASVVKALDNTRTEHMVKNRFNSLLRVLRRKFPNVSENNLVANFTKYQSQILKQNNQQIKEKDSSRDLQESEHFEKKEKPEDLLSSTKLESENQLEVCKQEEAYPIYINYCQMPQEEISDGISQYLWHNSKAPLF